MAIQVTCPQGHRLACPDDRAGKTGKCPKCGKSFVVPEIDDEPAEPDDDDATKASDDDTIVFLCPNGHKLNGPSSLQGQPGQCPHCSAKFRIPVYDEDEFEDDEEFEELSLDADEPAAQEASGLGHLADLDEIEEIEEIEEIDAPLLPPQGMSVPPSPFAPNSDDAHPLARLFETLWAEREHGGVVEIHLENRETVVPDWWAQRLSQNEYGVFALQTADGTYSIETIAWEGVKRISVRKISELPDGVFA